MAAGRSRFWRQLLQFGTWIVTREQLPRNDDEPSTPRIGASPLAWLASPNALPERSPSAPGRRGMLPWLASRDHLPDRPQAVRPGSGFFRWVTAREDLPPASSERLPGRHSFFRWLLSSEPDSRFENLHSTKEVPPHES